MRFFKKQHVPQEGQKGQSLVELALTLPVLILLLAGLLDLGRAYFTYIALEEAAAEAALFLAIDPDCPAEVAPKCADPNNALYRARTSGNGEFDFNQVTWNIPFDGDAEAAGFRSPFAQNTAGTTNTDCKAIGCTVIVQLRYDFELFTPIIQNLAGDDGIQLRVQASQIIVFEIDE